MRRLSAVPTTGAVYKSIATSALGTPLHRTASCWVPVEFHCIPTLTQVHFCIIIMYSLILIELTNMIFHRGALNWGRWRCIARRSTAHLDTGSSSGIGRCSNPRPHHNHRMCGIHTHMRKDSGRIQVDSNFCNCPGYKAPVVGGRHLHVYGRLSRRQYTPLEIGDWRWLHCI